MLNQIYLIKTMNKYFDNEGRSYTTAQINRKSDKAAKELLQDQFNEYHYNFCSKCKRNDCIPIDVSHTISKKEAKEKGQTQLCWDKSNMEILGRNCHQKKDKLNLKFNV